MKIADTHAKGPQDTLIINLAKSLANLARYAFYSFMLNWLNHCRSEIGKLRSSVDEKSGRDRLIEATPSRIDVDDIETLDAAVSSIIDVFHVRLSVPSLAHPSEFFVAREWRCGRR